MKSSTLARRALTGAALVSLAFLGCPPQGDSVRNAVLPSGPGDIQAAFKNFQVLGQGADFLTLAVRLPDGIPPELRCAALAVDDSGQALDKVTGFAVPDPALSGQMLFYLVLFRPPSQSRPDPLRSAAIRFTVDQGAEKPFDLTLPQPKTWGGTDAPEATPPFRPPEVIEGVLNLHNYSFRAKGDARLPDGFHFLGRISGADGHWTQFEPQSGMLGEKPVPPGSRAVNRGWLELRTGQAHAMQEAVSPQPPYIEGWWDEHGHFHPDAVPLPSPNITADDAD